MYSNILLYLRTGKLPEELGKNQRDALRRKSKNFFVPGARRHIIRGNTYKSIANADYLMMVEG